MLLSHLRPASVNCRQIQEYVYLTGSSKKGSATVTPRLGSAAEQICGVLMTECDQSEKNHRSRSGIWGGQVWYSLAGHCWMVSVYEKTERDSCRLRVTRYEWDRGKIGICTSSAVRGVHERVAFRKEGYYRSWIHDSGSKIRIPKLYGLSF